MDKIKKISIIDYLTQRGVPFKKKGNLIFFKSPFSRDSTWSFCVYPTNTFYDWSTGFGGNIVTLHSMMSGMTTPRAIDDLMQTQEKYEEVKPEKYIPPKKPFNLHNYTKVTKEEYDNIIRYSAKRGIKGGFYPGVFHEQPHISREDTELPAQGEAYAGGNISPGHGCKLSESKANGEAENIKKWVRVPSMVFPHVDSLNNICGAKFRRIDDTTPRFSARGKLGVYMLEKEPLTVAPLPFPPKNIVYIVEGEANANSLWEYLKRSTTVVSMGGVGSGVKPTQLPESIKGKPLKLIIDFDGDEELYQKRIMKYKGISEIEPIKLILKKGDDINSLFVNNKMYLIDNIISR